MAINDLTIEIRVKDKTFIIGEATASSNNDILKLGNQGMFLLEKRISDLGYKVVQKINRK